MFKFNYKVGRPLWKFFVRHGATPVIFVQILWDCEAQVFVAHDSNLQGLVTEAPTLEELVHNIKEATEILLEDALNQPVPAEPRTLTNLGEFSVACA